MLFLRDLRYGARILLHNTSFATAALAVVALGIGATTAVFTVVRAVLLQPLPYHEPSRLVLFRSDLAGYAHQPALTNDEFLALRDRADLFEAVSVINESEGNLTMAGDMEAITAASASDDFLTTLGVAPLIGRRVTRADIGTWVKAVDISYELWQRHWRGDPAIVGRQIEVNNIPMTVAGVLPRGFRLYLGPGVNVATRIDVLFPRVIGYERDPFRGQVVVARLRPNVSPAAAQAAVDAMTAAFVAAHPASYPTGPVRISLTTVDQDVASDVRPALVAVGGAVALVLLVACANLTNLLLARASARTRELAVRVSIGASRGQLVRQLAAESLVVGGVGAIAGLLLARWGVDGLVALAPATLPRREAIAVDGAVAAFAVLLSLLCVFVVSLLPAWHATRSDVTGMLKEDPASSRAASMTRGLLIAGQLALSLMLLVGAGLMARAFVGMRSVSLGFDPRRTVTMNVHLQVQRFNTGSLDEARTRRLAFYHQLGESLRRIPGVEQAGFGLHVPLGGLPISQRFTLAPGAPERPADAVIALAGFLETLRVPLASGRYFTIDDDDRPVVILDRGLSDTLWPGQSALGRRLILTSALRQLTVEVVGTVAHVQVEGLRAPGLPQIWVTYAARSYADLDLVVRASNPTALVPAVEDAVQRLGPGRPVHDITTLQTLVDDASADTRFALFVLAVFAALALALTVIGVYGAVAYATARRTREIAVRLALGAAPARIVALVVREGSVWTAGGLLAGLAGALAMSRYLTSLLFGIGERDPITFAAVALLLGLVAVAATAVPALRAVRIDPMLALRSE